MKRLLLCCMIISSSCAMDLQVMPRSLTYKGLIEVLNTFQLLKVREFAQLSKKEIERKAYELVMHLKDQQVITVNDSVFLSECIKGRIEIKAEWKVEPSTLVVEDLGIYCAALCSHDDFAQKLYRSSVGAEKDRYDQFIPNLFFVAIVSNCPVLSECILKKAALYYKTIEATMEFFAQLAPVLFYKGERDLLIRMCNALGTAYLPGSCQRMLLAGFDSQVQNLRELVAENGYSYDSLLRSILTGCCITSNSNRLEMVKYVWSLLSKSTGSQGNGIRFQDMLCNKAREAGNDAIAEYLLQ